MVEDEVKARLLSARVKRDRETYASRMRLDEATLFMREDEILVMTGKPKVS
jgi:hypothetical protein